MILNSDIILNHPLWERADNELCGKEGISLFNRLIDIYILACSIGIREDKTITEFEGALTSPKTIGRNTYSSPVNINLREALDFMLQNILISSKLINYDIDERLKLAFDPDYSVPKLSPASLLTGYANYGIQVIFEHVESNSPIVALDSLHEYFSSLEDANYEELLSNITLDSLKEII